MFLLCSVNDEEAPTRLLSKLINNNVLPESHVSLTTRIEGMEVHALLKSEVPVMLY